MRLGARESPLLDPSDGVYALLYFLLFTDEGFTRLVDNQAPPPSLAISKGEVSVLSSISRDVTEVTEAEEGAATDASQDRSRIKPEPASRALEVSYVRRYLLKAPRLSAALRAGGRGVDSDADKYVKVMDVPRDCQAVYETFVRTRKGSTPLPLTRVLITADTPPGDYVLAVEDVVDNALVQGQDEHDQKTTMLERETAHALRLTAAEASLEEALASAPAPSEGDPEGCEHETVVVARAALAEAQRPLAPVPRPLSDLGGMLRQVPRLATFYVPFKVFDPASVAEG